jgi:hypothetical protein
MRRMNQKIIQLKRESKEFENENKLIGKIQEVMLYFFTQEAEIKIH